MTRFSLLGSTTALATTLIATSAVAELTAEAVWANGKDYLQSFGYAVTATESVAGDVLTVSNLTLAVPIPEEDMTIHMSIPELTYTTQADGSVDVGMPRQVPVTLQFKAADGETVDIGFDLTTAKFDLNVSGAPNDLTYTYDADELALTLSQATVEGANVVPGIISFGMTMQEFDGQSTMRVGNARAMTQSFTLGDISYNAKFDDPTGGDNGQISSNLGAVAFQGDMTMPLEFDTSDPAAFLKGDFDFDGTYTVGAANTNFNVTAEGELVSGAFSSTGSEMAISMQDQVIAYAISGTGNSVQMQGGEIPFPISFAMDSIGTEFAIPLGKKDEEQPFGFGLNLTNFTMADLLWSIFDPAGQLPRDPATIELDMIGSLKLLIDLFNPEEMAAVENGEKMPGELQTLSLKSLVVDAVGARLSGMGDFTFDNTDLQTYDGIPKPVGAVDLELSGANALIDKLIAMGLLPEEQAMGARMMMSMFAVPAGDDQLKSRIELNAQGQILANGQRIR